MAVGVEELKRMVVRLVGDGTSYQQMLQQAQEATKTVADAVQVAADKIEDIGKGLQSFAGSALKVLGVFGATTSLEKMFTKSVDLERTMVKLSAAIESNGRAAGPAIAQYTEFAARVGEVTLLSKMQTFALIQSAEGMGFSGKQAEQVVTRAIALAKGNGDLAQSYIRVSAMMERGHPEMAKRILGLQGVTDKNQLLIDINKKLEQGLKVAAADANTLGGQIEKLKRSFAALTSDVGDMLTTAARPVIKWLTEAMDWFRALDPQVRKTVGAVVGLIGAFMSAGPLWAVLAPFLKLLTVTFTGPVAVGIGLVALAVTTLANQVGGMGKVWDVVKEAAGSAWDWVQARIQDFVAWVKPIGDAVVSLWKTTWGAVKDGAVFLWGEVKGAFTGIWEFIKGVWDNTSLGSAETWNKVRDVIVGAVKIVEMVIANLGSILGPVWGLFEQLVSDTTTGIIRLGVAAYEWITGFISNNREAILTLSGIAAGALAAYGAFKLVMAGVGVTASLLSLLRVQQILGTAVWLAWKGVMLTTSVVLSAWNVALTISNAIVSGSLIQWVLWGAAVAAFAPIILAVKVATWLWNAALAVTNALLSATTILAIAGSVVVLTAGIIALGAVVYAVYETGKAVIKVFDDMPSLSQPINAIKDIFGEWLGIIKDVIRATSVDMALAWKMAQAGLGLAVAQMRDVWPPLWDFIKDGFMVLWELISTTLAIKIRQGVMTGIISVTEGPAAALMYKVFGIIPAGTLAKIGEEAKLAEAQSKQAADTAALGMKAATSAFRIEESDATREAREKVKMVKAEVDAAVDAADPDNFWNWMKGSGTDQAAEKAKQAGLKIGDMLSKGVTKETSKLQAALSGSVEAMARIEKFRESLADFKKPAAETDDSQSAWKQMMPAGWATANKYLTDPDAVRAVGRGEAMAIPRPDVIETPWGTRASEMVELLREVARNTKKKEEEAARMADREMQLQIQWALLGGI